MQGSTTPNKYARKHKRSPQGVTKALRARRKLPGVKKAYRIGRAWVMVLKSSAA